MGKRKSRRYAFVAGSVLVITLAGFAASPRQDNQSSTTPAQAWVGARIIDGTGKPAIENATLLIRNGRIEAVGKRVRIPAGAEQIDARGKTIIPGLISAHGHVNDPAQFGVYLRDGITTLLSLGGDKEFALRQQSRNAQPGTAPRLYVAGLIQDSSAIPGAVAVKTPKKHERALTN